MTLVLDWIYDLVYPSSHNGSSGLKQTNAARHQKKKRSKSAHSPSGSVYSIEADEDVAIISDGYYSGLVNISGTYCFMNSVLQSFASLNYLLPYLDAIQSKAEQFDVPTPVVDTLKDMLTTLNNPNMRPTSIRPISMIDALSAPARDGSSKSLLFSSREHQDAQELFQLLSSLVKDEATTVDLEAEHAFVGLTTALNEGGTKRSKTDGAVGKGVFDGLTANRRSCVVCGYTEAVMHFGFDNIQLSLPFAPSVTLEEVLEEMTRIEVLTDCVCRKCSLLATRRRLQAEVEKLTTEDTEGPDGHISQSKKKRIREAKKYESRVAALIQEGRIEEDIKGLKLERSVSQASTKQAMLARAPPVLTLHLNRSSYWGHTATKNSTQVVYPELLDLTPFTTSGQLSTYPSSPISTYPKISDPNGFQSIASALSQSAQSSSSQIATPSQPPSPRVLYLLESIVCHYGGHGFGHYICYRRKPRPVVSRAPSSSSASSPSSYSRFRPPTLNDLSQSGTGKGWLRISDEVVSEVGIETVLSDRSGVFLMFYERVDLNGSSHPLSTAHTNGVAEGSEALQASSLNRDIAESSSVSPPAASTTTTSRPVPSSSGLGTLTTKPGTLSSRASTPRIVRSVSAGIQPFSRPQTRASSPNGGAVPAAHPVLTSINPSIANEDAQILSSSTDTITPLRASLISNGVVANGGVGKHNGPDMLGTTPAPLNVAVGGTEAAGSENAGPNGDAHPQSQSPAKKHRARRKSGKK